MINTVIIVGRLATDIEIQEKENGNKYAKLVLAVPRQFKNEDGIYDTDFIDVILAGTIATNTNEYCKKGDLIGIKGRLETTVINNEDGTTKKVMQVVADKVTFLSQRKESAD